MHTSLFGALLLGLLCLHLGAALMLAHRPAALFCPVVAAGPSLHSAQINFLRKCWEEVLSTGSYSELMLALLPHSVSENDRSGCRKTAHISDTADVYQLF